MVKIDKTKINLPTNDYIFKRIFGKVGNEIITKGFLNSILDEEIQTINLEGNKILEKDLKSDKVGILDIKATLNDQITCNVEMQMVNHRDIKKRILFYWSKMYTAGLNSGQNYEKLKKTILILVANFEFEEFQEIQKGHTEWKIREEKFSKYILTDMFELHILELPKLQKSKQLEKKEELNKWVKFLLKPNEMGEVDMENNEALKKAKEEWDEIQKDEYEQRMAESRMIHLMDIQAIEETGYEKGLEEGLEKGIKQGIEQGEKEKAKKIAKKMLAKGESEKKIMELTELTKEEIEDLKKD